MELRRVKRSILFKSQIQNDVLNNLHFYNKSSIPSFSNLLTFYFFRILEVDLGYDFFSWILTFPTSYNFIHLRFCFIWDFCLNLNGCYCPRSLNINHCLRFRTIWKRLMGIWIPILKKIYPIRMRRTVSLQI